MSDSNEDKAKWKTVQEGTPLLPEDSPLLEGVLSLKKILEDQIKADLNKIQELRETLIKIKRGGTRSS